MKQQVIFIVFLTIVFTGVYFFLIRPDSSQPDSPEVAGVENPQYVLEETECRNVGGRLTFFYNDKYHNFAKCLDKEKGKEFFPHWVSTFYIETSGTPTTHAVNYEESPASIKCSPYLDSPNPPFICQEYLKMFMY